LQALAVTLSPFLDPFRVSVTHALRHAPVIWGVSHYLARYSASFANDDPIPCGLVRFWNRVGDVVSCDLNAGAATNRRDRPRHDRRAVEGMIFGDEVHRLYHPCVRNEVDEARLNDIRGEVVLPCDAELTGYFKTIRYEPPGRRSNRSIVPVISPGGNHSDSTSGSTRAE
jgi:hypothetical protein